MQTQFFDEVISKIKDIAGIDLVYFLNKNYEIIKEHKITPSSNNHHEQVIGIIKSEALLEKVSTTLNSNPFHTCTLLNELGLMVISKLSNMENLYMITIAGENEAVDLIKLLNICKEIRSKALLQAVD